MGPTWLGWELFNPAIGSLREGHANPAQAQGSTVCRCRFDTEAPRRKTDAQLEKRKVAGDSEHLNIYLADEIVTQLPNDR